MNNRALTLEETYALAELIIRRGKRAQIRARARDGTIYWIVLDPVTMEWVELEEPIIGIPTYPAGALN